jgi:predicted nucleic acid-binding protein
MVSGFRRARGRRAVPAARWDALRLLIEEAGTAGNLTSDAHLAALAVAHGAVLVSFDGDFERFKGLRWSRPEASPLA